MYLKLHYRSLLTEAEALTLESLRQDLQSSELDEYSHPICASVAAEFKTGLQPADLERAGLIGTITTSHIAETPWDVCQTHKTA